MYQSLLTAAESCLEKGTYENISVRTIATQAGVHPAMINYYFGGKKGLFVGLIGFVSREWSDALQAIESRIVRRQADPVTELVAAVEHTFTKHQAIVKFIVFELARPDSVVRESYLKDHASRVSTALTKLIETGCAHGAFRRSLNSRFMAFSIMNMVLHPFSLSGNLMAIYGIEEEALSGMAWRRFIKEQLELLLT